MSPPGSSRVRVVVTDTNILINLIHVGHLELLKHGQPGLSVESGISAPVSLGDHYRRGLLGQSQHAPALGRLFEYPQPKLHLFRPVSPDFVRAARARSHLRLGQLRFELSEHTGQQSFPALFCRADSHVQ